MTVEHQPRIFGIVPVGRAKELACGKRFLAVARGSSAAAEEWQVVDGGNAIKKVCGHELKAPSGVVEAIDIGMLPEEKINRRGLRLVLAGSHLVPDMVRWRKTT